jgi:acetyl-CoA C-acetyltransferase
MKADGLASIAGIDEFRSRLSFGKSAWQIKAECAARALADAGLDWQDVDALYDCGEAGGMPGFPMAEYLGLHPSLIDNTAVGGSSFELHAAHADTALSAGRAQVALLTYGSTKRSGSYTATDGLSAAPPIPSANMELRYGLTTPGAYAICASRHMARYGTTAEQLAAVSVTARAHALRNPDAVAGLAALRIKATELTAEMVLASPMIADPLHLLDCCLINDGGGAVVIVAPDLAADRPHPPVWIPGAGEATRYLDNHDDITVSAAVDSGRQAFGQAGVRPGEIDVAMIYDSFTITVIVALEDLGFCAKGEGGAFADGGRLRFDEPGGPALNTDGGGLSSSDPGMRGIFLLIEATRQLRGTSTAQVPGARLAVSHGTGGWLTTRHVAGTVVLGGTSDGARRRGRAGRRGEPTAAEPRRTRHRRVLVRDGGRQADLPRLPPVRGGGLLPAVALPGRPEPGPRSPGFGRSRNRVRVHRAPAQRRAQAPGTAAGRARGRATQRGLPDAHGDRRRGSWRGPGRHAGSGALGGSRTKACGSRCSNRTAPRRV